MQARAGESADGRDTEPHGSPCAGNHAGYPGCAPEPEIAVQIFTELLYTKIVVFHAATILHNTQRSGLSAQPQHRVLFLLPVAPHVPLQDFTSQNLHMIINKKIYSITFNILFMFYIMIMENGVYYMLFIA